MEASGINMRRYPSYSSGETCCGGDDSEYGLPSYVPAPVPFPFSPISTKRRSLGARGLLRCSWLPWVLWFVVVGGLLVFLALYGSPISIQIHIHQAAAETNRSAYQAETLPPAEFVRPHNSAGTFKDQREGHGRHRIDAANGDVAHESYSGRRRGQQGGQQKRDGSAAQQQPAYAAPLKTPPLQQTAPGIPPYRPRPAPDGIIGTEPARQQALRQQQQQQQQLQADPAGASPSRGAASKSGVPTKAASSVKVLPSAAAAAAGAASAKPTGLYALTATDIDGRLRHLSEFVGKVSLVVNVASGCGYADQNYRGLMATYNKYKLYGLEVLAFPCNQFGGFETGSADDIKAFAAGRYGTNFPLFSKVDANGPAAHPVYDFLKRHLPRDEGGGGGGPDPGDDLIWNFQKILVNRQGYPVRLFYHNYDQSAIETAIFELLVHGA